MDTRPYTVVNDTKYYFEITNDIEIKTDGLELSFMVENGMTVEGVMDNYENSDLSSIKIFNYDGEKIGEFKEFDTVEYVSKTNNDKIKVRFIKNPLEKRIADLEATILLLTVQDLK